MPTKYFHSTYITRKNYILHKLQLLNNPTTTPYQINLPYITPLTHRRTPLYISSALLNPTPHQHRRTPPYRSYTYISPPHPPNRRTPPYIRSTYLTPPHPTSYRRTPPYKSYTYVTTSSKRTQRDACVTLCVITNT